jgi:hypothetical protein
LGGVEFEYDPRVFTEVTGEEVLEESPLGAADDKPDENFPRHPAFHLKYGERIATIRVISISDYRRMYAVSDKYAARFDEQVDGIRKASNDQGFRIKGEMPFVPFYDAHQEFQDKIKKLNFPNGKGFFFLTAYTIEATIINNEDLNYYFQGITDDGAKYILADFPVAAPFLPNEQGMEFESFKLPDHYDPKLADVEGKQYQAYISKIAKRLERLPDDQYQPDLKKIQAVVSSLRIEN